MDRQQAEATLRQKGWLAWQPVAFQDEVLARCALVRFQAGDVVYRMGDEPGGIYGLISGNLTLNTAPADRIPRLIQTAQVGLWAGEDCFLGRQPRRVQLQVRVPTVMMHLPLAEMDRLAAANPEAVRYFAQILMSTVDSLVRITSDLQKVEAKSRIAAILDRACDQTPATIPLTQAEIGEMSGATRRQVDSALRLFTRDGWIKTSYGRVEILDPQALHAYCEQS